MPKELEKNRKVMYTIFSYLVRYVKIEIYDDFLMRTYAFLALLLLMRVGREPEGLVTFPLTASTGGHDVIL